LRALIRHAAAAGGGLQPHHPRGSVARVAAHRHRADVQFQVTPGQTGTLALSLTLPIVNTAWLTNTKNGRSVSATVMII